MKSNLLVLNAAWAAFAGRLQRFMICRRAAAPFA